MERVSFQTMLKFHECSCFYFQFDLHSDSIYLYRAPTMYQAFLYSLFLFLPRYLRSACNVTDIHLFLKNNFELKNINVYFILLWVKYFKGI